MLVNVLRKPDEDSVHPAIVPAFVVIVTPEMDPVAVIFCAKRSLTSICAALIVPVVILPPSMVVVLAVYKLFNPDKAEFAVDKALAALVFAVFAVVDALLAVVFAALAVVDALLAVVFAALAVVDALSAVVFAALAVVDALSAVVFAAVTSVCNPTMIRLAPRLLINASLATRSATSILAAVTALAVK